MSTFLYFADNFTSPIAPAVIDRFGLRYAFDNRDSSATYGVISGRTPSNGPGTIFADAERLAGADLAYRPDEQIWRAMPARPDTPRMYVGCRGDAKPTPADLERKQQLDGELVRLADGKEWRIPRLRMFAGEEGFRTALPVLIDVDDAGELVVGGVAEDHTHLERIGQRLLEGMFQAEIDAAPRLTVKEAVETVAVLLATNYVVSIVELGKQLLGALATDDSLMAACRAAVEWQTAIDWTEKKSALAPAG